MPDENYIVKKATACLKNGGVIICPTESCYSFSCDAGNRKAVECIHEIKQDTEFKPMTIMVSKLEQIEKFAVLNAVAEKLAKKLMPGQINLVVNKKDESEYNFLSRSGDGIAFRIPNNEITLEIIRQFGSAITTTSVNLHGQPGIYDISKARELFEDKVCAIVDGGNLDKSIPVSTIYDTRSGKILREGLIKEKDILMALR